MTTVYVLLMVWSSVKSNGGIAVMQQEFNSQQSCETARAAMATAHNGYTRVLSAQGCFKK